MAVFLAPVAVGVVGGGYLLAFTKAHTSAANFSAQNLLQCKEDPYEWPFWKSWFDSNARHSQSTTKGTLGAIAVFGISFWLQKKLVWQHVGRRLQTPGTAGQKIKNTAQFATIVGPGIVENSLNGFSSSAVAGFARPYFDGIRHQ